MGKLVTGITTAISALMVTSFSTIVMASTIIVQPGQTMYTIAQSENISLKALETVNPNIAPTNMLVGTILQIPSKSNSSDATYVIQPGDTLWKIAQRYEITVQSLVSANPSVSATNLIIGSTLNIPTTSIKVQNLYWMERLINAEANRESLQTQIAVGDVVLNRVKAGDWGGSTVYSVVFAKLNGVYQFTTVANGTIYNTPNTTNVQATIDVLQNGENLVPNAYVFYNPSKTSSTNWVRSQKTIVQYGALVFAQ